MSSPVHRSLVVCASLLVTLLPVGAQDRQFVQQPAAREKRVALVIGNSAYPTAPLKNPVHDAEDITKALQASGFEVIEKKDLDQNGMKRAIREFGMKIRDGGVALFYYAGHGLQVKGNNYLVPVDAEVHTEEEVEYETVDAGFVLAQMDSARTSLNIVILDACRNNPFARSFRSASNGLAKMDAPDGTLIAYATAPGSIASDGGAGRNGIYTRELLKVIAIPDLSIEDVFKRVRISVHGVTQGKQTPWESSSLMGDFSFRQSAAAVKKEEVPVGGPGEPTTTDPVLSPSQPRVPLIDYERVFTQREVDQKPLITSKPPPSYTESARKDQVQGRVLVQAVLDRSGSVREIRVVSGSELGHGLPEQATAAARRIKFTPAVKDGRAVSVQVTFEYYFSVY
ncbi:MAG TPA: TonB family protein [Pyrinomonadaceae bacterium]|nr:TonB family protein [Pyrinomonadaceae bacterium]